MYNPWRLALLQRREISRLHVPDETGALYATLWVKRSLCSEILRLHGRHLFIQKKIRVHLDESSHVEIRGLPNDLLYILKQCRVMETYDDVWHHKATHF